MIQISHSVGRREENFPFLLFFGESGISKSHPVMWRKDTGYKCQIAEINIMRRHLQRVQRGVFGLFIYDVSSGTELSFAFPGKHTENMSMMLDELKYCYGFSPRNINVLTQLLSVHCIF